MERGSREANQKNVHDFGDGKGGDRDVIPIRITQTHP